MSDAHTDPLIPRITDEMLAAGGPEPASALDDRTLAELLAELEEDDQYALDEMLTNDEPSPKVRHIPAEPAESEAPVSDLGCQGSPNHSRVEPPGPPGQRTAREAPAPAPAPAPIPGAKDDFLDEDDSHPVIRDSPLGPVVRSRYGDFRPPIEREPEAQTLTGFGLTRRSRSKVGSILFTVVFVAIFLLILLQAIVSLVSAPGH